MSSVEVKKDDIGASTPLSVVVQYLKQVVPDKFPRDEITVRELDQTSGKFELIDLLEGLCKND